MNLSKNYYLILSIIIFIIILLSLLLSIVFPFFIIFAGILVIIEILCIKRIKRIREKNKLLIEKEEVLLKEGYKKLYNNIFINKSTKKININGNDYDFSRILDYKLITDESTINSTYTKSYGKIKSNGKIGSNNYSLSTDINYCNIMYINITTSELDLPNIKLDILKGKKVKKNSKLYNEMLRAVDNICSTLKIIISENNK